MKTLKLTFDDVAGLGVEPSLEDYEPSVQPYTTPHVLANGIIPRFEHNELGHFLQKW